VNGYEALAGAISDLADWAEDAVAGGDPSPRAVIQQATERQRQIAYAASMAARGRIAPDDLGGMLGQDSGDTLMLGHGRPVPEPSGWRRAWRAVRRALVRG
jgi:hypothetical protein